jgi:hypothetical protein
VTAVASMPHGLATMGQSSHANRYCWRTYVNANGWPFCTGFPMLSTFEEAVYGLA